MKQVINLLGMLYFSCLLLAVGSQLNNIVIPLRLNAHGVEATWIGITMSANSLGLILGCAMGRKLVGRVGFVRTFVLSCAIFTGVVLIYPLWVQTEFWIILRIIGGFFTATAYLVVESWINGSSNLQNRGRVLGSYLIIHYTGTALGQLFINLDGPDPSMIFTLSAIAIAFSAVPVAFSVAPVPEEHDLEKISWKQLYNLSPVGLTGVLSAGLLFSATMSMGPIYGRILDWSVQKISIFMAVMVLGSLLFQYPLGKASDAWDRRKMLAVVQLSGIAIVFLMWIYSVKDPVNFSIWGTALILGGVVGSIYPLSSAVLYDWLNPAQMVAASGKIIITFALGAMGGPFLAAVAMDKWGAQGFLIYLGLVMSVLMIYVFYRVQVRSSLPVNDQEEFVLVPRVPPVSPVLDPRTDPNYYAADSENLRINLDTPTLIVEEQ